MCSCSASTQTAVYETMESAGGPSNRVCSSVGKKLLRQQHKSNGTKCHFGTEDVAVQQRDHLLKWWAAFKWTAPSRSNFQSCVTTMTCATGELERRTFICVKPLKNAFHARRRFLFLPSLVVSAKCFPCLPRRPGTTPVKHYIHWSVFSSHFVE